jgi:hypothetical protein
MFLPARFAGNVSFEFSSFIQMLASFANCLVYKNPSKNPSET